MDNSELMKLFDFILENTEIVIADNELFTRDMLRDIRRAVNGKKQDTFILSSEQEKKIIETFKNGNKAFNIDTPKFITNNPECIKHSLTIDLSSVDYIQNPEKEAEEYIIDQILGTDYILKQFSPEFLKDNVYIALQSINISTQTADYIHWNCLNYEDQQTLIEELIKLNYRYSRDSHPFLVSNFTLALSVAKNNIDNIEYLSEELQQDKTIFELAIMKNYPYHRRYIYSQPLKYFTDPTIIQKSLQKTNLEVSDDFDYSSRFCQILADSINKKLQIKDFEALFDYIAEEEWEEYRLEEQDFFSNILGRMLSELRDTTDLDRALYNMDFYPRMMSTLAPKDRSLYNTIKAYHETYHSNDPDKQQKLEDYQSLLAKFSGLYIAKYKESYKQTIKDDLFHESIEPYFKLKLDQPYIQKRLTEVQKLNCFKNSYANNDDKTIKFLQSIIKNYQSYIGTHTINKFINDFLMHDMSETKQIIPMPYKYEEYITYKKVSKIINRLNSGYIKFDGPEVEKYKHLICFDPSTNKYFYDGEEFSEEQVREIQEYQKKDYVFSKIKRDIMAEVHKIEIDTIDEDTIQELYEELPLTDEYYEFDDEVYDNFTLRNLMTAIIPDDFTPKLKSLNKDSCYNEIYNFLTQNNILWLLLFQYNYKNTTISAYGIDKENIAKIINNMPLMIAIAKKFNFNLKNLKELFYVNEIYTCISEDILAVLDKNIIEKLYTDTQYTNGSSATRILSAAKELVCQMSKRYQSTVPYISGNSLSYKYSVYDPHDQTLLLAGIDTDSCFKVLGIDNDFLHYCACNKNGFVIKITDPNGNFIGRASGFRNGNCILLNQLRTIYDEGGNHYTSAYEQERIEIIDALKQACESIINTSQNNPNEILKIDYAFITRSYALYDYEPFVTDSINNRIGSNPMNTNGDDWKQFKKLPNVYTGTYFNTDFGDYKLIRIASKKEKRYIKPSHIKFYDAPALYERTRNKIIVQQNIDTNILEKLNKIKAIKAYFSKESFISLNLPQSALVITGDNWYIINDNGEIIEECLLEYDPHAKIEFEATKRALDQKKYDIDSIEDELKQQTTPDIKEEKHKIFSFIKTKK